MTLYFTYNADLGIIVITCEGEVSSYELINEQSTAFELAKAHNTDMFLLDLSKYKSSLSLFEVLGSISSYDNKINRQMRIAIVAPVSEEARQVARFYETSCVNRGWNVQMFVKKQVAIEWLVNHGK